MCVCKAEVDIGCFPGPFSIFPDGISEHSDLTRVVSHSASRILCLPHLSTEVMGPLSSLPSVHV